MENKNKIPSSSYDSDSSVETLNPYEIISSTDIVVYEVLSPTNQDEAREEFLQNPEIVTPHFVYGKLDKDKIRSNISAVEGTQRQIGFSNDLSSLEKRLAEVLVTDVAKKNQFVETCIDYQDATSPEDKDAAAKAQKAANEALYGAPDESTFYSLLSNELAKIDVARLSLRDKEMYDSLITDIGEIKSMPGERFVPSPETVKKFSESINLLFENFWKHIPEGQESFTTKEACDIVNEILENEFQEGATSYHAIMSETAKAVSVNHQDRAIIFPVNRAAGDFTYVGLKKIIVHELCTHAFRALVYENHPVHAFSHELPGNEEIDEGIAKCCEQAIEGKYSDSGIEHYINIGLANFKGKNFREIFEIQQKLLFLKKSVLGETDEERKKRFHAKDKVIFSRTVRCFRGTGELPNNKDLVYYNGSNRVWKYIEENIDNPYLLDNLFLSGKSDILSNAQDRLIYESKMGKFG